MRVFLSWSGEVSKQVALALRDWLPNVIQAIEPWMSSEDIEKGARWSSDIAKELATVKAGIICVTPDNPNSAWLNFEAGALSKTVEREMVCTYLFRLKPTDITGPLVQFQASVTTKDDTKKLVSTLNRAVSPKPLPDSKLLEAFDVWWGQLELKLSGISVISSSHGATRSSEEMLEEVLEIVRGQARTTQELEMALGHILPDLAFGKPSPPGLLSSLYIQAPRYYDNINLADYPTNALAADTSAPGSASDDFSGEGPVTTPE